MKYAVNSSSAIISLPVIASKCFQSPQLVVVLPLQDLQNPSLNVPSFPPNGFAQQPKDLHPFLVGLVRPDKVFPEIVVVVVGFALQGYQPEEVNLNLKDVVAHLEVDEQVFILTISQSFLSPSMKTALTLSLVPAPLGQNLLTQTAADSDPPCPPRSAAKTVLTRILVLPGQHPARQR